MDFRNDLRCFVEDLRDGRYTAAWIEKADEAMQARAAGDFDDFKEREYEEYWGQKMNLPVTGAGEESN